MQRRKHSWENTGVRFSHLTLEERRVFLLYEMQQKGAQIIGWNTEEAKIIVDSESSAGIVDVADRSLSGYRELALFEMQTSGLAVEHDGPVGIPRVMVVRDSEQYATVRDILKAWENPSGFVIEFVDGSDGSSALEI